VTRISRTENAISEKRKILAFFLAGLAGAVGGLFWNGSLWGLLAVAFVPSIGLCLPKGPSAIFFLFYYLSAIRSVPAFYPIFYSLASSFAGIPVWLAWGACLAGPWILARHLHFSREGVTIPVWLLVGYLPSFFPPLWFVGAVSPLFPAGILFPGLGISGLLLLGIFQGTLLAFIKTRSLRHLPVSFLLVLIATIPSPAHEKPVPAGWTAIDTRGEPRPLVLRPPWEMEVAKKALADIVSGERVVLLPEGIASFWTKDSAGRISLPYPWSVVDREARAHYAIVLVGSEIPGNSGMRIWDDDLVALGEGGIRLFSARQPIPVAGWNPFSKTHHEPAHWGKTGVVTIDGHRALVSLCFEDLLIGAQVEGELLGRPEVVLSADNLWFSKGTSERGIQSVSIRSIGRLFGIPVLRAVNQ